MNVLGFNGLTLIETNPRGFIVRGGYGHYREKYFASPEQTKRIIDARIKNGFISKKDTGKNKPSHNAKCPSAYSPTPTTDKDYKVPEYLRSSYLLVNFVENYWKADIMKSFNIETKVNTDLKLPKGETKYKIVTDSVAVAFRNWSEQDEEILLQLCFENAAYLRRFDDDHWKTFPLDESHIRWR